MRRGDAIIKARHLCGPSAYLVQNGAEFCIFFIDKTTSDQRDFSGASWEEALQKAQRALKPEPDDAIEPQLPAPPAEA